MESSNANRNKTQRRLISIRWVLHAIFSLTFDSNYVSYGPSTIDVAPASVAADGQRAADVPHLAPATRVAHPLRHNSRGSRCLSQKEKNPHSFGMLNKQVN